MEITIKKLKTQTGLVGRKRENAHVRQHLAGRLQFGRIGHFADICQQGEADHEQRDQERRFEGSGQVEADNCKVEEWRASGRRLLKS